MFKPLSKLNTGVHIPGLGFSTWRSKPTHIYQEICAVLKAGYRHIDVSTHYGHELNIGKALRQPGIHRSDIFISTNIWNLSNRPCDVKEALDESLAKLGLEYVDLLYLENRDSISTICNGRQDGYLLAPGAPDIWASMEKLSKKKTRGIGVANFNVNQLKQLANTQNIVPAANRVLLNPRFLFLQEDLIKYCQEHKIKVVARSAQTSSLHTY